MIHDSTRTIESKEFPGVRFVIRKMTKRRADALNDQQEPSRAKLQPLYEELIPLEKERKAAGDGFPADKEKRWAELLDQIGRIDQYEMAPVALKFCLVRIEDLEISYPAVDGKTVTEPATLELLTLHGPDELYTEILHEVKRECGLLPPERENLSSPSTSGAAVDGSQESAAPAEPTETITAAAA